MSVKHPKHRLVGRIVRKPRDDRAAEPDWRPVYGGAGGSIPKPQPAVPEGHQDIPRDADWKWQ